MSPVAKRQTRHPGCRGRHSCNRERHHRFSSHSATINRSRMKYVSHSRITLQESSGMVCDGVVRASGPYLYAAHGA
jgi:hypothetical protein